MRGKQRSASVYGKKLKENMQQEVNKSKGSNAMPIFFFSLTTTSIFFIENDDNDETTTANSLSHEKKTYYTQFLSFFASIWNISLEVSWNSVYYSNYTHVKMTNMYGNRYQNDEITQKSLLLLLFLWKINWQYLHMV